MNPIILIPSYWTDNIEEIESAKPGNYDHATDVRGKAELADCFDSLDQVAGITQVAVILVAEPSVRDRAYARVKEICDAHPNIPSIIVDREFSNYLQDFIQSRFDTLDGEPISLRGYGAIKNLGLCVASILGHDVAVFLDDDEVVLDENFLINAVYGLGQQTISGASVLVKSGYFLDRRNSPYAELRHARWYNKRWAKREEFNEWMNQAQSGPRISHSNILVGGIFAVHAEAFTKVAFDSWITRGEDLDYLINLHLFGFDVWFDNKWSVKHMPPKERSTAPRFMQNIYRWVYEYKKLEYANSKIDLIPVSPESLLPYPGKWLGDELFGRIKSTALRRALGTDEKAAYFDIFLHGIQKAQSYAEENTAKYLEFQELWPDIIRLLWENEELQEYLTKSPA
ncbi:MAG: hypothetical protein Q4E22_01850 [Coriobacteriia bacterium]|nr:hypothetical protein [Coriobacteriia bacterium]